MKNYTINNLEYTLIINEKDGFELDAVNEKYTDYFEGYDYLVGDWSYGKLRLKGFCKTDNKLINKINNYDNLDNYIKSDCAYGCKYFVLEKID